MISTLVAKADVVAPKLPILGSPIEYVLFLIKIGAGETGQNLTRFVRHYLLRMVAPERRSQFSVLLEPAYVYYAT